MKWTDFSREFPAVSAKQWKQQVQYELQGVDYTASLVWESPEGIQVKPIYSAEDLEGTPPTDIQTPATWNIAQPIEVVDALPANEKAKKALEAGITALQFILKSDLPKPDKLLAGIDLEKTEIHFRPDGISHPSLEVLIESLPIDGKTIFIHLDPIGFLARNGNWASGQKNDLEMAIAFVKKFKAKKGVHVMGVDSGLYANAGANIVQQLAYSLAHAREYCHYLGNDLNVAPAFTVAMGPQYFFEIAKLRALRQLWKILATEYGLPTECHILARPGYRNKTLYDYNINMLRSASECMSAILGNADTVLAMSYDRLFKHPNDFGERIARNQLLILKHEAHFDSLGQVVNGTYFIESLTWQLAEKALELFKQIEAGGGFLNQLKEHKIQKKIRENAAREQQKFDEEQLILVGTNAFVNKEEGIKEQLEHSPFRGDHRHKTLIEPLVERRLAAKLEAKRLANE